MSIADLIRAMNASGSLAEAIAIAVGEIEAKDAEIARLRETRIAKEARAERNARYYQKKKAAEEVRA